MHIDFDLTVIHVFVTVDRLVLLTSRTSLNCGILTEGGRSCVGVTRVARDSV